MILSTAVKEEVLWLSARSQISAWVIFTYCLIGSLCFCESLIFWLVPAESITCLRTQVTLLLLRIWGLGVGAPRGVIARFQADLLRNARFWHLSLSDQTILTNSCGSSSGCCSGTHTKNLFQASSTEKGFFSVILTCQMHGNEGMYFWLSCCLFYSSSTISLGR